MIHVEPVDTPNVVEVREFLHRYEDTSLFLLGNLENYGFRMTEVNYSGNFKLLRNEEGVIGVICLARSGNLLFQLEESCFDEVLAACFEESVPVRGVVGEWERGSALWEFLKAEKLIAKETFTEKDILYIVALKEIETEAIPEVELYSESDFVEWRALRQEYIDELNLPDGHQEDHWRRIFQDKVRDQILWGMKVDGEWVATADLNAKAGDLGQVGGVYTKPAFRRSGIAKKMMKQIFHDAKHKLGLRKLIIFTGEDNVAARRVYESLGAHHKGYFALLFGESASEGI